MRIFAIHASMIVAAAIGLSPHAAEGETSSRKPRAAAKAELKTGKAFQAVLAESISATWQASEIGEASQIHAILRDIGERFHIAIVLDRRVDPHQHLTLEVSNQKLRDVLEQIAVTLSSPDKPLGVSFLTNVVYIGPKPASDRLRTLIELRTRELDRLRSRVDRKPTAGRSLTGRYSHKWDDLQNPGELLEEWTKRHILSIENPELIEHDLWRAGELPLCTITEACSIVLNQFDLTFAGKDDGTRLSLELVPVPERVFVESTVSLKSLKADRESLDELKRLVEEAGLSEPATTAKVDSDGITVEGRVEAVEELMAMLSNVKSGEKGKKKSKTALKGSLSRKVFTLTVRDAPLSAILEKLKSDGIAIEYDADAFRDAGIDLSREITVSVEQVSTEELLKTLFESQPVDVSVKKEVVYLTVQKK
ncbi:MAG: hypothetical protein WEB58_01435 [Planctomycetaceae bacterium]